MSAEGNEHRPMRPVVWARLLLLLPFIGSLWVAYYNSVEPSFAGVPFFYWYQMLWVLLSSAIIGLIYVLER